MKGELFLSIVKRAYRHLQNHTYFLIFMLSFYLLYFILVFAFVLLIKQFSDSAVQLNKIIESLNSQQISLDNQPFKMLETITTHYIMEYKYILLLIGIAGTVSLLAIQLFLSKTRQKEYHSYLLMGERVYKLTFQLIIEQLLLINSAVLFIFILYSFFTTPILSQVSQLEADTLQQELQTDPSSLSLQSKTPSSDFENESFTRFNVKPFLLGESINSKFVQNNTLQTFLIMVLINLYSCIVIGIPNFIILSLRKNKLS